MCTRQLFTSHTHVQIYVCMYVCVRVQVSFTCLEQDWPNVILVSQTVTFYTPSTLREQNGAFTTWYKLRLSWIKLLALIFLVK